MTDRVARIRISCELLLNLFQGEHHYRAVPGVPADARVVTTAWVGDWLELLVESDSFAPVPPGEPAPLFNPTFRETGGMEQQELSAPESMNASAFIAAAKEYIGPDHMRASVFVGVILGAYAHNPQQSAQQLLDRALQVVKQITEDQIEAVRAFDSKLKSEPIA